jgi:hypothetical protein
VTLSYVIDSISEYDGKYVINGVCECGYGANMPWVFVDQYGVFYPRCNKCKRGWEKSDVASQFVPVSKEHIDFFHVKYVLEQ